MPLRSLFRLLLILLLGIALNACSGPGPLTAATEQAIALQVNETQEILRQQLYRNAPEPPTFSINHVRITDQEGLSIQEKKGYHIRGTYDVEFDFGDRQVTQRENSFDLYLQRDSDAKLWSLARPDSSSDTKVWTLQPLSLSE